jgi:site-specific recombinase XerD
MTRLRAPKVTVTAVPVFTSVELSELAKACQGSSFAAPRDAAIIAVFTATGIRLSELAGIRCPPDDPVRSDLDLHGRQIRIRGKRQDSPDRQDRGACVPAPVPAPLQPHLDRGGAERDLMN